MDKKSPSASGRDFAGGLQFMKNQNRTFADSVIDHHKSSLTKNSSSPTAVKSSSQLPGNLDMPKTIGGYFGPASLNNRSSDPKTKGTPFDDILGRDDDDGQERRN